MNEFKEVLNNNLDAYELYKKLNNKDDYIIFHLNIVKYVLDREGVEYEWRDHGMSIEYIITFLIKLKIHYRAITICYSEHLNKIAIHDSLSNFFNINKETIYEELKEFLIKELVMGDKYSLIIIR